MAFRENVCMGNSMVELKIKTNQDLDPTMTSQGPAGVKSALKLGKMLISCQWNGMKGWNLAFRLFSHGEFNVGVQLKKTDKICTQLRDHSMADSTTGLGNMQLGAITGGHFHISTFGHISIKNHCLIVVEGSLEAYRWAYSSSDKKI